MATYTIGTGQTYTTLDAFIDALNLGTIGTAAEVVIGSVVTNLTPTATSSCTNTAAASITIRSSVPGEKRILTRGDGNPILMLDALNQTWVIEDLDFDGDDRGYPTTNSGLLYIIEQATVTVNRCTFRDMSTTNRRALLVTIDAGGSVTLNMNDCLIYNATSTRDNATDVHGGISLWGGIHTVNVDNCVIDKINSTAPVNTPPVYGIARGSGGTHTVNVRNTAVTRITGSGTVGAFHTASTTVNQTTNATFNTEGAVQNITQSEYTDPDNGDFTTVASSQLQDAGTDLGNVAAAVTYDFFDRHADPSRDPWDIGAFEALVAADDLTGTRNTPAIADGRLRLSTALVGRGIL